MTAPDHGIVHTAAAHSVDQAVEKLQAVLAARGITLFALIDHGGEAVKAGFEMRPTKLLIFGDPRAGTPLMLAAPTSAIDLPLKVLVWEDGGGQVWLSHNAAEYLRNRHGLPDALMRNVGVVEALVKAAAG